MPNPSPSKILQVTVAYAVILKLPKLRTSLVNLRSGELDRTGWLFNGFPGMHPKNE